MGEVSREGEECTAGRICGKGKFTLWEWQSRGSYNNDKRGESVEEVEVRQRRRERKSPNWKNWDEVDGVQKEAGFRDGAKHIGDVPLQLSSYQK